MSAPRLALILALALAAGESAKAQDMLLAGGDDAVWLVRASGKTFDVVVRPAGGKWSWADDPELSGVPVAASADARLHLLLRGGGYLTFGAAKGEQLPGPRLDAPAPSAVCAARDFGEQPGPCVLAVVKQNVSRLPATRPRTLPGTAETQPRPRTVVVGSRPAEALGPTVYQSSQDGWKLLPVRFEGAAVTGESEIFAAAVGKTLYVLLSDARPPSGQPATKAGAPATSLATTSATSATSTATGGAANRLYACDGRQAREVSLAGPIASAKPVAMLAIGEQLAVVLAALPTDSADAQLLVASSADPGRGFQQPYQPLAADGTPLTWRASSLPLVSRLGDHLALAWREGGARDGGQGLRFATFDVQGRQLHAEEVVVFQNPPVQGRGQEILTYFLWGVMIAVIVPLIARRRPGLSQPPVLAPGLVPAGLLKRLVAFLIDLLPFLFIGGLAFLPALPAVPGNREEFMELMEQHRDSDQAAYAAIASLTSFAGYCVVMERRFGATLGKMLFGIRVVVDSGGPPGMRESCLRNLWKIIELLALQPLPLLLLAPLLTRLRQRLGDMVARTTVVHGTPLPPSGTGQDAADPSRRDDSGGTSDGG